MKLGKILFTAAAILMVAGSYAQNANRTAVCQSIPNLSPEQKQKIDKFSVTHQKTMDDLRTSFWSESDAVKASQSKALMITEMDNHYQNISALLTLEQQIWYDQNCNVNTRRGYYRRGQVGNYGQGYGRGQGYGLGRGRGRGRITY